MATAPPAVSERGSPLSCVRLASVGEYVWSEGLEEMGEPVPKVLGGYRLLSQEPLVGKLLGLSLSQEDLSHPKNRVAQSLLDMQGHGLIVKSVLNLEIIT